MSEPRFLLKDKNSKTPTIVYLVFRLHNQRLKYSTGLKIIPKNWNFAKQLMNERKELPYKNFNKIIENYKNKIKAILLELQAEGKTATVAQIKFKLQQADGAPNLQYLTVNDYFPYFLKEFEKRKPKSKRFFEIAATKLTEFNPRLQWADLNEITYRRFVSHLEKQNYSDNYIGSILNKLRIIFNDAAREGILKHTAFKTWKRKSEDVYKVYLTEAEIKRLYTVKLPKYQAHARDLFIIGCCTGLRVENYLNIDSKIQVSEKYIQAIVNKNGPRVKIPVHWMVAEIIKKYKGLPAPISEQKLNDYIKLAAAEAKINTPVQWFRTQGGRREIFTNLKCEMVSSHTARRSFATNLYLRGENPKVIMDITGHRSVKMFFKYIKITSEESSRRLARSAFFKKEE